MCLIQYFSFGRFIVGVNQGWEQRENEYSSPGGSQPGPPMSARRKPQGPPVIGDGDPEGKAWREEGW